MDKEEMLCIQLLFLGGIAVGYNSGKMETETLYKYFSTLAKFVSCLLASQFLELACLTVYNAVTTRELPKLKVTEKYKPALYVLGISVGFLMYHNQSLFQEDSLMLLIACVGVRFLELKRQSTIITYGEGMACSFSEGYLYQVIPSDGAKFVGLEEQIKTVENNNGVVFPVRRLLIVITKSLYCPPNLEEFNKNNDELPSVEACRSLPDVEKHVAGVQNRIYRNTSYKIKRHINDPRPVYVVAECATPLHTLWKVLQKRAVYERLATADRDEICHHFCTTLPRIIDNSPELRGKCDLVYYDDTDPNENIAEVLLAKVRELEPDFENITRG